MSPSPDWQHTMHLSAAVVAIAFLLSGDIWTVPVDGGRPTRVTNTGGAVETFRYSADGRFLAWERRIRDGDNGPDRSIVIVRVPTGAAVTELTPSEGTYTIDGWLGDVLAYHAASSMEVSGQFEYDVERGTRRELDQGAATKWRERAVSPDFGTLAWVDDTGLGPTFRERLHLTDRRTGADSVYVQRRSVMSPAFASDSRAVAFVEVTDDTAHRPVRDRIWVYRPGAGPERMVYDGPVRAKGGGPGLAWSPDSRWILMNFGGRSTIVPTSVGGGAARDIVGNDACWVSPSTIAVAWAPGVELVDVTTGARRVIVAGASSPQCIDHLESSPGGSH